MTQILLAHQVDLATWRRATRYHVFAGTRPEDITWLVQPSEALFHPSSTDPQTLFSTPDEGKGELLRLPRRLVERLVLAIQAHEPERFSLLYRLVFRVVHEQLDIRAAVGDPDVEQLDALAEVVTEETHRFRTDFAATFRHGRRGAWACEPAHYIIEANAAYCLERVAEPWAVQAGYRRMQWDGRIIQFGPGSEEGQNAPLSWQRDGAGVWQGYPKTVLPPTADDVAKTRTLDQLGSEAMDCRACALWEPATRTVFGEGPVTARVMLVGEQPGDQEDLAGHPFVGPAGQVLDRALREAEIERPDVYVTNAVKHFRFVWRNTRRLHQKPDQEAVDACRIWLNAERRLIQPILVVMMGVTAAQSLLKRPVTISRERSRIFPLEDGSHGLVTVHPSYLLRLPNEADKQREYQRFLEDLRQVKRFMEESQSTQPSVL